MISPILKKLIESRGCMTIAGPRRPQYVHLEWLAGDGKKWQAIAPIYDRHNDLEFPMTEVIYCYIRQRHHEDIQNKKAICPRCGSPDTQRDRDTSDHPGVFECLNCDHGFLA